MTSPLTEQRTTIPLLWLKLDHETQPGGRFCFWVASCSVVGGTPEGESKLMDQALLDAPYSRQWRGCRRDWDGRPVADPSLLSQTHHNYAKSGLVFWDPPAYAMSAVEVCSWHMTKGVERFLPYTLITVVHVIITITCKEGIQKCRCN